MVEEKVVKGNPMKASELISCLQEIMKKEGDIMIGLDSEFYGWVSGIVVDVRDRMDDEDSTLLSKRFVGIS